MNESYFQLTISVEPKLAYCKPEVKLLSLTKTEASKNMMGAENMMGMDNQGQS